MAHEGDTGHGFCFCPTIFFSCLFVKKFLVSVYLSLLENIILFPVLPCSHSDSFLSPTVFPFQSLAMPRARGEGEVEQEKKTEAFRRSKKKKRGKPGETHRHNKHTRARTHTRQSMTQAILALVLSSRPF